MADDHAIVAKLDAAAARLRANEPVAALRELLDAWRAHASAAIAGAVDVVSAAAEAEREPIAGRTHDDRAVAALALLRGGDPADLPRVFRALPAVRTSQLRELVAALARVPPDPRFARLVAALVAAAPWGMSTARAHLRALFEQVAAHGDPRAASAIGEIDAGAAYAEKWAAAELANLVRRHAGRLAAAAPVAPSDSPAIAAACRAVLAAGEAERAALDVLAAAAVAHPLDRAARAVYADALIAANDPRGEFIQLQLATAPTFEQRARERELWDRHGAAWTAAIAPACARVRFAAGFPVEVELESTALADARAGDPAWRTVESVWLATDEQVPLAALRGMPALRFVGNLLAPTLDALADAELPITGVGTWLPAGGQFTARFRAALGRLGHLPIRALVVYDATPAALRWLWDTPLGARLQRLHVRGRLERLAAFRAAVPAHVEEVSVGTDHGWTGWTIALARGADGGLSQLAAELVPGRGRLAPGQGRVARLAELAAVLAALPPDALDAIHITTHAAPARAAIAAIATAAARQHRLRHVELNGEPVQIAPRRVPKRARAR